MPSDKAPKSGRHMPYADVLRYGRLLGRELRRVQKVLHDHGADPDMALVLSDVRRHLLGVGKELRETAAFGLRMQRELLQVRELRNLALAQDAQLSKLVADANFRAGNRRVSNIKDEAKRRIAGTGLDPAVVDALIDDVTECRPTLSPDVLLRMGDVRVMEDLADLDREVSEALSSSEEEADGTDGGTDRDGSGPVQTTTGTQEH